jgi:hypothetical protein
VILVNPASELEARVSHRLRGGNMARTTRVKLVDGWLMRLSGGSLPVLCPLTAMLPHLR